MTRRRGKGRPAARESERPKGPGRRRFCDNCGAEVSRLHNGLCEGCVPALASEWSAYVSAPSAVATIRRYGITEHQHAALFRRQKGLCAICRDPERSRKDGPGTGLVVDHDHETGVVRGLLCTGCNVALGMLMDRPEWVGQAKEYLHKSRDGSKGERRRLRKMEERAAKLAAQGDGSLPADLDRGLRRLESRVELYEELRRAAGKEA